MNFLALLGWSPGGDREVLSRDELQRLFALEGISGGNAVFNPEKLDWFNQQHIARLPAPELLRRVESRLRDAGLWRETLASTESPWIGRVLELLQPRVRNLDQLVNELSPFLLALPAIDPGAAAKYLPADVRPLLASFASTLQDVDPFDAASVEASLRHAAEAAGMKAAALIHATRVAVTGRSVSAGLFDLLVLLGKDQVGRRLRRAVDYTP